MSSGHYLFRIANIKSQIRLEAQHFYIAAKWQKAKITECNKTIFLFTVK